MHSLASRLLSTGQNSIYKRQAWTHHRHVQQGRHRDWVHGCCRSRPTRHPADEQIGKAIAKQVVARDEPITFLATSRQGTDIGLTPSHPDSKVEYPKLDLTSDTSISALRELVKAKCGGVVDVMILNAGGDFESGEDSTYGPEAALKTFDLSTSSGSLFADWDRLLR